MTWGAVGAAAVSVVGGAIMSDGASGAAGQQGAGGAESIAEQRRQYDQTRADNAPFLRNGTNANNRLAYLMGLSGDGGGYGGSGANLTAEQIRSQLLPSFTTAGRSGAPQEGDPGYIPGDYVMRNGKWGTWMTNGDQSPYWYSPDSGAATGPTIDEAGLNAAIQARLSAQGPGANPNDPAFGSLTRKFGQSDLDSDLVYQNGLQFGLNEGVKGINRQAAATGSSLSGATLKALTRFGNDYGTTKTEGAYNRYNTDQTNQYNRLAGLSGTGQVASGQVQSAGMNAANQIGATQQNLGNARGASTIAQSNALAGGLNGAGNALFGYLNKPASNYGGVYGGYGYNDIPMQPGGGY